MEEHPTIGIWQLWQIVQQSVYRTIWQNVQYNMDPIPQGPQV